MGIFLDRYRLKESDFLEEGLLYEGGLNRVIHHTKSPFMIITAFRGNYSLKENRRRNKQLSNDLKKLKMGGIKLVGHWEEAPSGLSWKDAKKAGQVEDVIEESLFVPKSKTMKLSAFEIFAQDMAKKYNQDAVLFGDGEKIYLIFKGGGKDQIGKNITVNKLSQAYSTLRRKPGIPFVFEGTVQPSNNFHRMAMQRQGLLWFTEEDE